MLQLFRERPRAFVYAVLVHVVLLAVLVFSLDWAPSIKPSTAKKPAPVQAVVVDGAKLDAEVKRREALEAEKQREAKAKAEAAKRKQQAQRDAQLKRKEEARKKAEAKKQAEAKKRAEQEKKRQAALAAKKKAEAEKKRKAEAERKRKEAEAKARAEAERKRKAAEAEKKRKAEAERKRREEEARRKAAEAEMQARLAAEQERLAAQRHSAMQSIVSEYVQYIKEKVQRSWIRPAGTGSETSCTVEVRLIPSGDVIDATIVRSSGNAVFDRSVETAVFKASPLPVPSDPEVMEQFRTIRFDFNPGSS